MRTLLTAAAVLAATALLCHAPATRAGEKGGRVYEMRTYYAAPGKLDELHARFRDHTTKLFEKHGMTNVGYWVPLDNPDGKLIYLMSYPSREARDKAFKAFGADPEWQRVKKQTEAKGRLVTKVEEWFFTAADYSPEPKPAAAGERVFELRIYKATPGNLGHLNARFRDHTLKLFEKHGITNIGYWVPLKGQKGADDMLVYIISHKSRDAAKASFDSFRKDPAWIEARKASEEKGGGSLTAKDGIQSIFMKATDYSPIK
jgi:hypothetical protein